MGPKVGEDMRIIIMIQIYFGFAHTYMVTNHHTITLNYFNISSDILAQHRTKKLHYLAKLLARGIGVSNTSSRAILLTYEVHMHLSAHFMHVITPPNNTLVSICIQTCYVILVVTI